MESEKTARPLKTLRCWGFSTRLSLSLSLSLSASTWNYTLLLVRPLECQNHLYPRPHPLPGPRSPSPSVFHLFAYSQSISIAIYTSYNTTNGRVQASSHRLHPCLERVAASLSLTNHSWYCLVALYLLARQEQDPKQKAESPLTLHAHPPSRPSHTCRHTASYHFRTIPATFHPGSPFTLALQPVCTIATFCVQSSKSPSVECHT